MFNRIARSIADQGGFKNALRKALRKPGAAIESIRRMLTTNWQKLLFMNNNFQCYVDELNKDGFLDDKLKTLDEKFLTLQEKQVRGHAIVTGRMRALHAELIYSLIRDRKPSRVIETGVCNGLSSSVILYAMDKNQKGELVSIDLPEFSDPEMNDDVFWEGKGGAVVPAGEQPGWLVPSQLRYRWFMEIGRSQDILENILREKGPLDIFIHDSEHSYENQLFEFTRGYEALKTGGVLIATDINWSDAFDDFWDEVKNTGAKCAFVDPSCAVVTKNT
ncbi:class I SAM-dependent methyltransferase [Pseudomonadota bacterium]